MSRRSTFQPAPLWMRVRARLHATQQTKAIIALSWLIIFCTAAVVEIMWRMVTR